MPIRISHTANNRYQTSPRSYYLHSILKLRPKYVGSALIFGGVFDEASNTILLNIKNGTDIDPHEVFDREWKKQKINGEAVDLSKTELIKYSKSDYDDHILTDEDREEIKAGKNPSWVSLKRKGHMMIDAYQEQVVPQIKEVLDVQTHLAIENEDGDSFIGWADAIVRLHDDKIYIADNKSSSIKYKPESASESPQLASYFEIAKEKDIYADGVLYIVIPKKFRKRKEPKIPIELIKGEISEELIDQVFTQYDETLHGIKMGNFPCTGCHSNPFGCDYKRFCESDGQDMTGLIYVGNKKL